MAEMSPGGIAIHSAIKPIFDSINLRGVIPFWFHDALELDFVLKTRQLCRIRAVVLSIQDEHILEQAVLQQEHRKVRFYLFLSPNDMIRLRIPPGRTGSYFDLILHETGLNSARSVIRDIVDS